MLGLGFSFCTGVWLPEEPHDGMTNSAANKLNNKVIVFMGF